MAASRGCVSSCSLVSESGAVRDVEFALPLVDPIWIKRFQVLTAAAATRWSFTQLGDDWCGDLGSEVQLIPRWQ